MGDEVIGHVSALQYSAALDTPKNEAFVKKYRAKYGKVPSYYSETNYTTAQMIHEVIKKQRRQIPGPEEFVKQLAAIKVDTLRGPVSIDEMRNPVQNIYIKKVEKKKMFGYDKDELWNTVIKTYPNVNQFGQFNKDEFLKHAGLQPRLSRPANSATSTTDRPGLRVREPRSLHLRSAWASSVTADTPANGGQPVLELKGLSQELRRPARRARRHAQDHARRPQGHHRPERRRQDDAVQPDHRDIPGDVGTGAAVRPGRDEMAEPPAHRAWAWRGPSRSPACFRG